MNNVQADFQTENFFLNLFTFFSSLVFLRGTLLKWRYVNVFSVCICTYLQFCVKCWRVQILRCTNDFIPLYFRDKDEHDICRGWVKQKSEATRHEATETRDSISGHTYTWDQHVAPWSRAKDGFEAWFFAWIDFSFARYLFLHYSVRSAITIGITQFRITDESRLASGIFVWGCVDVFGL